MSFNWLDITCKIGVAAISSLGAAAGGLLLGGPPQACAGLIIGGSLGFTKSDEYCKQAAHNMYMRQKCEALYNGEMYIKIKGKEIVSVKTLADRKLMPLTYYEDLRACEEGGFLPKGSTDMLQP